MQKKRKVFEPLASYSQDQNRVVEIMRRTLIDMTRAKILEGDIEDELWPELVLVLIHIKKKRLIRVLANNLSPHKSPFYEKPELSHVQILGSIIYILVHKEKCIMKSKM